MTQSSVVRNDASLGGGIANVGGTVTVTESTIRDSGAAEGGGIHNIDGRVTITHSRIVDNIVNFGGGGFFNQGGMVTVTHSTLAGNDAAVEGAFSNVEGTVIITDSTIADNRGDRVVGSGIGNGGFLTILNSTITRNRGRSAAGISNRGQLFIVNSTIADNVNPQSFGVGVGIVTRGTGSTVLLNTILARNELDCVGPVTSLGTNLIGDPTGCTITLQPSDLTGDPGLDTFTDDGTPGNGHFPLLSISQAIDAGNDAVCPKRDQLGQRRIGRCDIGAIRFLDGTDLLQEDDPATAPQAAR